MPKYILLLFCLCSLLSVGAQESSADQEILGRAGYLMSLPTGTHKIYNGKGGSVFDVLYTIEVEEDKTTIYKGGSNFYFDMLYTIVNEEDRCSIYKGSSNSTFNQIYTILRTRSGYEIYKGRSTFFSDLLYSYER